MVSLSERLKVAVSRVKGRNGMRDTALVALAFCFPSATADELAAMTVGQVRGLLGSRRDFPARLAVGAVARLGPDDALVFASRKGSGTRPAHRVTVWRVLQRALGGGFRFLRRLLSGVGARTHPHRTRPVQVEIPSKLTLAGLMKLSGGPSG